MAVCFPIDFSRRIAGQTFAAMDRPLDKATAGPFYLRQPELADMIVEAIHYSAAELGHYQLWAFVVMPNHVHLLVTPVASLPKINQAVKGITAKRANLLLALTGRSFWQEESYDRFWSGGKVNSRRFARTSLVHRGESRACPVGG